MIMVIKLSFSVYHLKIKFVLFWLLRNCPNFRYRVLGLLLYFTIKTAEIQTNVGRTARILLSLYRMIYIS